VEAVAASPRRSYRAHAEAKDVESALDVVVERLERQIRDHHERRLARRNAGAGRVKSGPAARQDRRARGQERGVTNKADTGKAETGKAATGPEKLRVLVCDDHALFRRGLKMVLDEEPDLELVGEASDGAEVVVRAQELMPDVILMDVRMPKRSGIEAAGEIKDSLPHVKILMLTISDDEADLYEAIKAGASGYLLKEIPIEEVADAIRSVWAGQSRISPSMASKLLTEFAAMSKASDEKPQMPAPKLTDREMEVLRLVAQGLNNRDIAGRLFISENTVKNHIRNILEKLHLHSRMEAVVYAVREKMIEIT
jgi:DNA-binding NarL/FixJ family response regulator